MDPQIVRSVSIVVPCFDEEQVIAHAYRSLCTVLAALPELRAQICLVDDGSRDGTLGELTRIALADPRVRVVALSRNFGHQAAITAGLDHADRRADAVFVMDADLETPPELLPRMLETLAQGFDVVMGVRERERSVGTLRRLGSRWFYATFNLLSDVPITPGAPDFYLLSARAREALARMPERNRFLRGMVTWLGFPRANVPYRPGQRPSGRSKYTLRRMVRLGSDALFSFSSAPVKLTLLGGVVSAGVAGVGLACLVARALLGLGVPSWALISGLVGFACGLQLLAIGALGSYVVRNLEESRGRPLYLVRHVLDARGVSETGPHDVRLVELAAEPRLAQPRAARRSSR